MFVALRDLRFATGRFALMGTVVVLMTLLVGLLSGLTAGLSRDSTSAVTGLPADHIAFSASGEQPSFTDSTVKQRTWREWAAVPGVRSADPLGITTGKARAAGHSTALSTFGVQPGSHLAPRADQVAPGSVVLSTGAASKLGAKAGDTMTVNGSALRVGAVAGDASYSHTPVMWTSLSDWQRFAPGEPGEHATAVALTTSDTGGLAAADHRLGTHTVTRSEALSAIGSYTSENGSLQLMRGFLFGIGALVIGAFFMVWTIQRRRDIAVLKALGATTGYLLRDALGQAAVLLTGGAAVGTGLAAGLGALAAGTVPFVLDASTVLLPALAMVVLGVLGAALSVRRITAVDPLAALGASS